MNTLSRHFFTPCYYYYGRLSVCLHDVVLILHPQENDQAASPSVSPVSS